MTRVRIILLAAFVAACQGADLAPDNQQAAPQGEWTYFGGDRTFSRYSALDQIDRENVADLRIAWRRPGIETELKEAFPGLRVGNNLRSTPILIDRTLFAANSVGLLRALDPATGESIWEQQPFAPKIEEARGTSPRGVDIWRDGEIKRLLLARGEFLYSVDASTGELDADFGEQGRVSLHRDSPWRASSSGLRGRSWSTGS